MAVGESRTIGVNVTAQEEGRFALPAQVSSDDIDTNTADNTTTAQVVAAYVGGGGCSAASGPRPLDPMLPALGMLGLIGWALRRVRRH